MRIGSLCSGIGGLDEGLRRAGLGDAAWMVERDPWCRSVLTAHWPSAEFHDDVAAFDPRTSAPVELVCGGWPCQPVSLAGKRRAQADERWLWPHVARIVAQTKPKACVFENVLGLRSAGLRDVLADLAALGFDVEWTCLSAFDVGAPHLRRRLFIVATHPGRVAQRLQPGWLSRACESARAPIPGHALESVHSADADRIQSNGGGIRFGQSHTPGSGAAGLTRDSSDADCLRRLESSWRLAEQRGWARKCGWNFDPVTPVDDVLSMGLVRGETERARKALGNAVVIECAEVVGRALIDAIDGKAAAQTSPPVQRSRAGCSPRSQSVKYSAFVAGKLVIVPPTGIAGAICESPHLFDFQRDLVQWALRRGRAAIFASTGCGKTRMQVTWCDRVVAHTGKPALILAPLAVASQTAAEGAAIGVDVNVCRSDSGVRPGINVANYERLHLFDTEKFGAVAMDESSRAKDFNSKTLAQLKESFARTPFRLSCSATPSPNDYTELGTQAELLGICSRQEMLSEYFVHDGGETQTWRLKGHARTEFWKFVASWGALVRSPADLGYDASAYALPPLHVEMHTVAVTDRELREAGTLFAEQARGLMEQRNARKSSMAERVRMCAERVAAESSEPWVVWAELNSEQDELAKLFGDECASVYGSLDADEKERRLLQFVNGEKRILLTKPSIAGWGINMQRAARMAFVGVSNSWESYHQAVRRCYRFGQKREVRVHLFASELEGNVVANLRRKEADAQVMAEELSRETAAMVRAEVTGSTRKTNAYKRPSIAMPAWMKGESQ